jgi:hypothetical protein
MATGIYAVCEARDSSALSESATVGHAFPHSKT